MRDTVRLRLRLQTLAHTAMSIGFVTSCTSGEKVPNGAADTVTKHEKAEHQAPQKQRELDSSVKVATAPEKSDSPSPGVPIKGTPASAAEKKAAQEYVPGYLLGDPPYVEGWDPEEEPCPSGNWCAPVSFAEALRHPYLEADKATQDGCPAQLLGKAPGDVDFKQKAYRGISEKSSMRGTFQPWRTKKAREAGAPDDWCCYHWFEYCSGRPLLVAATQCDESGRISTNDPQTNYPQTWANAMGSQASSEIRLVPEIAQALASAWCSDADDEYASVAAFARASLELMQVGAPLELIAETQRASLDEIEHAKGCRWIAGLLSEELPAPRELPALELRQVSRLQLMRDTFVESCLSETIAALRASRQRRAQVHPAIDQVLARIEDEEAKHAALGWKIVQWCLDVEGDAAREFLAQCIQEVDAQMQASRAVPTAFEPSIPSSRADWAKFGRLDAQQVRNCAKDAWQEIVKPMAEGLIA